MTDVLWILLLVCLSLMALAEWAHRVAMSSRISFGGSQRFEDSSEQRRTPQPGSSPNGFGSKSMPRSPIGPVVDASDVAPLFLSCGCPEDKSQRLRAGDIAYCFSCCKWSDRI